MVVKIAGVKTHLQTVEAFRTGPPARRHFDALKDFGGEGHTLRLCANHHQFEEFLARLLLSKHGLAGGGRGELVGADAIAGQRRGQSNHQAKQEGEGGRFHIAVSVLNCQTRHREASRFPRAVFLVIRSPLTGHDRGFTVLTATAFG